MKLFRWAAAGASVYVIYKYSIGKKAKGENVFDSPVAGTDASAPAKRTRAKRTPRAK
jgi:hypothetical protein